MKITITNKFREITDYTREDKFVATKIFEIISSIIEYDVACISFSLPDSTGPKNLIFDEQNVKITPKTMRNIWDELFPNDISSFRADKTEKPPIETHITVDERDEFKSKLELNFYCDNSDIGKLCFFAKDEIDWEKMPYLDTVKAELDVFLRLKYLYAKTRYLSITDELTQLYTRRHLKTVINQEFERARRYGSIITVAMVDIDNFKMINDRYGHLAGDYVLKEIAHTFTNALRKSDYIYRYGGEELCILMPETALEKAYTPLERLRKTIETKDFIFEDQKIDVTISIGTATYKKEMQNPKQLIEKADTALYQAKRTGKNKVVADTDE